MSQHSRPVAAVLSVLLVVAAAPPPVRAEKDQPRPYPLALEVAWGDPSGPETWREELERAIADEIGGRNCFRSVGHHDPSRVPEPPLMLRVSISDFIERSTYGVGIWALEAPDAPPGTRQSQVAEIRAMFDLQLISLPGEVDVRSRRFGDRVSYQPVMQEDPRYESRSRLSKSVSMTIATFVCKGSNDRFARELARARDEAGLRDEASR